MTAHPSTPAANRPIPLILADSEGIFRFGISRLLASEPGIEVVSQPENLRQTLDAVEANKEGVLLFDTQLSLTPAAALSEVLKHAPALKVVMLAPRATEDETVSYLRRGACGVAERSIRPDLLVRCVRKVWEGEVWLSNEGVNWLLRAYAEQSTQMQSPVPRVRLNEKEMLIIAGVARGMKNKDIAAEIGTTEQVVKNYLRKVYDKLGIGDRLELALYCVQHRLLEKLAHAEPARGFKPQPLAAKAAAAAAGNNVWPFPVRATDKTE